jgi:hypothetical protein
MRWFGFRLMLLVGILWAGIGLTVRALGNPWQPVGTVYVMPSSLTLPVPTSYVVSTSWVEPTAYAVPTYYTTAYWMDPVVLAQPAYAPTAYVRRGFFGRRWLVERPVLASYTTSYVPTAYYASPSYRATSYALADRLVVPSAYVASADCICPPALASTAPTYPAPSRGTGAAGSGTGSYPRTQQGQTSVRESIPSTVGPAPTELNALGSAGATGGADTRDTSPVPPSAGVPPPATNPSVPNPQGGQAERSPARSAGATNQPGGATNQPGGATNQPGGATNQPGVGGPAPVAPGGTELSVPPLMDTPDPTRRDSFRPNYAMRPARSRYANVLMGTVLSRSDGLPEEGVQISVRNTATGTGKTTSTDAFGKFAVRLADGDWAVDVTMPSGTIYRVSQLRIADGDITDSLGRRIPTLEITR